MPLESGSHGPTRRATGGLSQSGGLRVGARAWKRRRLDPAAVLGFRHTDGANQLNGYADTTGYQPVNTWDKIMDADRWQPLCVPTPPPGATSATAPPSGS
jgi:hypothetical protein